VIPASSGRECRRRAGRRNGCYCVSLPGGTEAGVIWTCEHACPPAAQIAGHVAFRPDRSEVTVAPA
jgi:uncharacterized protein (DUF427 family)